MFPTDSVQSIMSSWWEKYDKKKITKGCLVYAFVPHVDQIPITLTPKGRKQAEQHDSAIIYITPLRINDSRPKASLPVAALSLHEKELWTAYRAKKRPCLVLGTDTPVVDNELRRGMPKKLTAPTVLVAPYYGVDKDGSRAGYNPQLVQRIRHAEYPQFFWDELPISGPKESILRFDHLQAIGLHYYTYELSGYKLSDEAIELIIDDWLQWLFFGGLPKKSFIIDYQKNILSIYG